MIHAPERLPHETQAQYRERQAASKRAVAAITKPPHQTPAVSLIDVSRFWLGQHTNPARNKVRRARRLRKFAAAQWLSHWQATVKERKHKQHVHPLRDEHGAYTLVGAKANGIGGPFRYLTAETPHKERRSVGVGRRKWLGGISAQRGF